MFKGKNLGVYIQNLLFWEGGGLKLILIRVLPFIDFCFESFSL